MAGFKGWEAALLRRLRVPVTKQNVRFLRAWQRAEGGGARFNPLNTTHPRGRVSKYNSVGVGNYASPRAGIEATARTLEQSNFNNIVKLMRRGASPVQLAQAEARTPWGTGSLILKILGSTRGTLGPMPPTGGASPGGVGASRAVARMVRGPDRLLTQPMFSAGQIGAFNFASDVLGVPQFDFSSLTRTVRKPGQIRAVPGQRRPLPTREAAPGNPVSIGSMKRGLGRVTVSPGADRQGVRTKGDILTVARIVAGVYGKPLRVGTGTNHSRMTTSGNVSEHWSGHAVDIGATGAALTRLGQSALIALGVPPAKARKMKGGLYNVNWHGRRIQVIFNTHIGGNHYNHLHLGIR